MKISQRLFALAFCLLCGVSASGLAQSDKYNTPATQPAAAAAQRHRALMVFEN